MLNEHLPTHIPTGLWAPWQGACLVSFCNRSTPWQTSLKWCTWSINCPLGFEGAWWEGCLGISGSREAWTLGTEPSRHAQLCPASALPSAPSPPCPTEGLYLGRATEEDDNARARAGHPGARTEWIRHQATPGLTVSATTGDTGSLENSTWSRRSALRKCPRSGVFLSGDSLTLIIAWSRVFYSKLLCVWAGSQNMAPAWDSWGWQHCDVACQAIWK